ncbi:MAG: isocitrate/isopropylmalate dehydrogenase family protein [Chloroflexota bacterium]|nr:isocitrate/isopropylmalate dehydrogenase family protein [Chloroflexota bacterium]
MTYQVCLVEGDGIGHEVVPAGKRLLEATGLPFTFTEAEAGWATFQRQGTALPEETLQAVMDADATLFGAVSSPLAAAEGYRSPIVSMRRALQLYANLRPAVSYPVPGARKGVDLLIVRENSEGLYSGRERSDGQEAVTERVITRGASERVVRMAFRQAQRRRGHVTIVHKANVLRATCGLFREVALDVAEEFPAIQVREMLVDAAAMRLVRSPEEFDVIVTTNLFGDILSDEAAGLVGGLGLAPSANMGDEKAIFEPVHGSAPDIAGRGIANPVATFFSVAMLLDYLGEEKVATRVREVIEVTLCSGPRTPDLGGKASMREVTEAVIDRVRSKQR